MVEIQAGKFQQIHEIIGGSVLFSVQMKRLFIQHNIQGPQTYIRRRRLCRSLRHGGGGFQCQDHIPLLQLRVRWRFPVVHQRTDGPSQQLRKRPGGIRARARRNKADLVPCVNHRADRRVLSVESQNSRRRRLSPQNHTSAVQRDREALP